MSREETDLSDEDEEALDAAWESVYGSEAKKEDEEDQEDS
jgi:hypothetical protein